MLTRDQILAQLDLKTVVVSVPEWKTSVKIRELSAHDRDEIERDINLGVGEIDYKDLKTRFCVYSLVDDEGKKLFTKDDMLLLADKSPKAINTIYEAVNKLNYMREGDLDKEAKNSSADPSQDTATV